MDNTVYVNCLQYVVAISNGELRFDVIENVNINFYISSVCRKQNVGDVNLCHHSGFLIIFI